MRKTQPASKVQRIISWYKDPVCLRRGGLAKESNGEDEGEPCGQLEGTTAMNPELRAALGRLMSEDILRSLELWSVVAEAARSRGVNCYTGTVPTESLWAHLRNVLGLRTQTIVKPDLWEAMNSLVFHRFCFQRANVGLLPTAARHDPLVGEAIIALHTDIQNDGRLRELLGAQS